MKITENIIAVDVPIDAINICVGSLGLALFFTHELKLKHINLDFGKVELLGEVTENSISTALDDYILVDLKLDFDGFLNLLQSKGLYFVNPIEKPEKHLFDDNPELCRKVKQYQQAESNLIKGKLIILKLIS